MFLNLLKSAVAGGELDEALEQAAIASRIGPKNKATKTVVRANSPSARVQPCNR